MYCIAVVFVRIDIGLKRDELHFILNNFLLYETLYNLKVLRVVLKYQLKANLLPKLYKIKN